MTPKRQPPAKRQHRAERPDEDNPVLDVGELHRARPARDVLPALIGKVAADTVIRRGRGRPALPNRKINQTIRIEPEVLEAYRQQGKGWQTLINRVLKEHMPARKDY